MAYMNQDKKQKLAPQIKTILKKYGLKGSISVKNHSTLRVTIASGSINFLGSYKYRHDNQDYIQVNEYSIGDSYSGLARDALLELYVAMMQGNHNNSDVMTDYFDVGWYIDINIGSYDKPYQLTQ